MGDESCPHGERFYEPPRSPDFPDLPNNRGGSEVYSQQIMGLQGSTEDLPSSMQEGYEPSPLPLSDLLLDGFPSSLNTQRPSSSPAPPALCDTKVREGSLTDREPVAESHEGEDITFLSDDDDDYDTISKKILRIIYHPKVVDVTDEFSFGHFTKRKRTSSNYFQLDLYGWFHDSLANFIGNTENDAKFAILAWRRKAKDKAAYHVVKYPQFPPDLGGREESTKFIRKNGYNVNPSATPNQLDFILHRELCEGEEIDSVAKEIEKSHLCMFWKRRNGTLACSNTANWQKGQNPPANWQKGQNPPANWDEGPLDAAVQANRVVPLQRHWQIPGRKVWMKFVEKHIDRLYSEIGIFLEDDILPRMKLRDKVMDDILAQASKKERLKKFFFYVNAYSKNDGKPTWHRFFSLFEEEGSRLPIGVLDLFRDGTEELIYQEEKLYFDHHATDVDSKTRIHLNFWIALLGDFDVPREGEDQGQRRSVFVVVDNEDDVHIAKRYFVDSRFLDRRSGSITLGFFTPKKTLLKFHEDLMKGSDELGGVLSCWVAIPGEKPDLDVIVPIWSVESCKRDGMGQTVLHIASKWCRPDLLMYLLDKHQSDINVQDDNGNTALHNAVHSESVSVVQLLLQNGACITVENYAEETPLDMAKEPIKSILLEYHPSPDVGDSFHNHLDTKDWTTPIVGEAPLIESSHIEETPPYDDKGVTEGGSQANHPSVAKRPSKPLRTRGAATGPLMKKRITSQTKSISPVPLKKKRITVDCRVDSSTRTVREVLDESSYLLTIPHYQRPYVWGEQQVSELFYDLYHAYQEGEHYCLGTLVIERREATGSRMLYDGQQRLTTLTILFSLIRRLIPEYEKSPAARDFQWHICTPESIVMQTGSEPRIKLQEGVREFFFEYFQQERPAKLPRPESLDDFLEKTEIDELQCTFLYNGMNLFTLLTEHFPTESERNDQLVHFGSHVLNNVFFVEITTYSEVMSWRIFSTLNERGLQLSVTDKLKAEYLGHVLGSDERKRCGDLWEEWEHTLGRDLLEKFFFHLATLRNPQTKKPISGITLDQLVRGDEIAEFTKEVLEPLAEFWIQLVNRARRVGPVWNVWDPTAALPALSHAPDEKWQFWVPLVFKIVLFLRAERRESEKEDARALFEQLERWFVVHWLCRTNKKKLMEEVVTMLNIADPLLWFESRISRADVGKAYKFLLEQPIYTRDFKLARFLLLRLETVLTEDMGRSTSFDIGQLSVEHIFPQNPGRGKWSKKQWPYHFRKKYLHKFGNLTLLSRHMNSSIRNGEWEIKREKMLKDYGATNFLLSREVAMEEHWTREKFEERHEKNCGRLVEKYHLEI